MDSDKLFYGALSIAGAILLNIVSTRLDKGWSKLTDLTTRRFQIRRNKKEIPRLRRVTAIKESKFSTYYVITECVYASTAVIVGSILLFAGVAILFADVMYFAPEHDYTPIFASFMTLISLGALGIITGVRKYNRLIGDFQRLFDYDDYKTKVEKFTAELTRLGMKGS